MTVGKIKLFVGEIKMSMDEMKMLVGEMKLSVGEVKVIVGEIKKLLREATAFVGFKFLILLLINIGRMSFRIGILCCLLFFGRGRRVRHIFRF